LWGAVLIAPHLQHREDGHEVKSGLGQVIGGSARAIGVRLPADEALFLQQAESVGEDLTGDSKAVLELIKALHAAAQVAQHEQRPPPADDLQGLRDGAVHVAEADPLHTATIVS
jgi:hypothetical protein